MKDKIALFRFFSVGAFVLVAGLFSSNSLFAQSQLIFCGKLLNHNQEAVARAQFTLDFYAQRDSNSHYHLDAFGCGYYEDHGIFWITTGQPGLQDTLILEIENSETKLRYTTFIVMNCDTSRIINLGEFAFSADTASRYIFIGDSTSTGNRDTRVTAISEQYSPGDVFVNSLLKVAAPYPNPFRTASHHSVNLIISLNANRNIRVYIYNILGRLVWQKELANEPPGIVTVSWPGHDLSNQAVASGNYIVVVQAGREIARKSIMVVN